MRPHCLLAALLFLPTGAGADPSLECSMSRSSQVEVADCVAEAEEAVNAAMGIALETAQRVAEKLDEVTEREVALPALTAAQTAWEAYRDAECEAAGARFGGGSGTGIAIRSCRVEVTRARVKALLDFSD